MIQRLIMLFVLVVSAQTGLAAELTLKHQNQEWSLTSEMLLSIKPALMTTQSPWDSNTSEFAGVYLEDLLAHFDLAPEAVRAVALNHYEVTIPVAEAVAAKAFIAVTKDSKPMAVRNKGPFWIIFPWQEPSVIKKQSKLTSWSIWQLKTLETTEQQ